MCVCTALIDCAHSALWSPVFCKHHFSDNRQTMSVANVGFSAGSKSASFTRTRLSRGFSFVRCPVCARLKTVETIR